MSPPLQKSIRVKIAVKNRKIQNQHQKSILGGLQWLKIDIVTLGTYLQGYVKKSNRYYKKTTTKTINFTIRKYILQFVLNKNKFQHKKVLI